MLPSSGHGHLRLPSCVFMSIYIDFVAQRYTLDGIGWREDGEEQEFDGRLMFARRCNNHDVDGRHWVLATQ